MGVTLSVCADEVDALTKLAQLTKFAHLIPALRTTLNRDKPFRAKRPRRKARKGEMPAVAIKCDFDQFRGEGIRCGIAL